MAALRIRLTGIEDLARYKGVKNCFDLCGACRLRNVRVKVQTYDKAGAKTGRAVAQQAFEEESEQESDEEGESLKALEIYGEHHEDGSVTFDDNMLVVPIQEGEMVDFKICHEGHRSRCHVRIAIDDLARQQEWLLMAVSYKSTVGEATGSLSPIPIDEAVYGTDDLTDPADDLDPTVRRPTFLKVQVEAVGWKQETKRVVDFVPHLRKPKSTGRKRVMLMTRGTRGDVQPFLALARGLILNHNCECTVCTEISQKDAVKKARAGLPEGTLLFRPSGGDTMEYTSRALQATAMSMGEKYDFLQTIFFARTESNFFSSEGAFYYWAYQENPDFIVFAFTVTHLAMIISEGLEIPIVGFILQPAREIEPRHHMLSLSDTLVGPLRELLDGEETNAFIAQAIDRASGLARLRRTRGLAPMPPGYEQKSYQYEACYEHGVQMIAPISPVIFRNTKPELQEEGVQFTDFIFLQTSAQTVSKEVEAFIKRAKAERRQVGLMTFSSMPVGEERMAEIAITICQQCTAKVQGPGDGLQPALIMMATNQDKVSELSEKQRGVTDRLASQGRLLILRKGEPFSMLFPKLDFVLVHGGLGVTSDALQAGIPLVTSGIQLLDQRWWGGRMAELECGSPGVPLSNLLWSPEVGRPVRVVELVNKALDKRPVDEYGKKTWSVNAKEIQAAVKGRYPDDPDGVKVNARAVYDAGCTTEPLEDVYSDVTCQESIGNCAQCCCGCLARCLYCLLIMQLLACLAFCFQALTCVPYRALCCPQRSGPRQSRSRRLISRAEDDDYGEDDELVPLDDEDDDENGIYTKQP